MAHAITAEEARKDFLTYLAGLAKYWATLPDKTPLERCNGLAFSVLTIIDGDTFMPPMDLVLRPHPDDEQFNRDDGDDWYEDGQVINDCGALHEIWHRHEEALKP